FVLQMTKEELIKNWTARIKPEAMEKFQECLNRRIKREPVAYIVGYKHFMGQKFIVDNRVLIPRPETEIMAEKAIHLIKKWPLASEQLAVVDVGTGCGNIALTMAKVANFVKVFAIDIDPAAIEVAKINASLHNLEQNVALIQGDLLISLPQPVQIIVANLPYICEADYENLEPEIRLYEPKSALTAGADGLDLYRRLLAQAPQYLLKGGVVLMEIDPQQVGHLRTIVLQNLPSAEIEVLKDLQGLDRVLMVQV
ncbi:MAG TPA: peptide chain release factor N(5)-glutamine methyltransferase, partial [Candidatus Wirthbacteria bacterium]|nr:peptide chain release factor N(5)-glutamine methyltransferase [Candidatus Wirthbacteria bacterium]